MDIIIHPSALSGEISAPSSKSYAHRALICAALADGKSTVKINTVSDDIAATADCLKALGADISERDGIFTVQPIGIPNKNAVLNCRESASTLRFLMPVVCALGCPAIFKVSGRLSERPLEPLGETLEKAGITVSDGFPVSVSGKLSTNEFSVRGDISSQYASGLLLALSVIGGGRLEIIPPVVSEPYIEMTADMLRRFGVTVKKSKNIYYISGKCRAAEIEIEGDYSNSLVWLALGIGVKGLNENSLQGDGKAAKLLGKLGNGAVIDASDIPDAVPILAAMAATASGRSVITGASRLRFKESDRLSCTAGMLSALGADISVTADGLVINGKPKLDGGRVKSYGDHRIAFAAALAAAKCENDVIIEGAECVKKSYPDFFEKYNELGGKADVVQYR